VKASSLPWLKKLVALALLVAGPAMAQAKSVELKEHYAGRKLRNFLESLAQGNEGSVAVTSLRFDTLTGEAVGEVVVTHRHSWGKATNPASGTSRSVYSYDVAKRVRFEFNIRKPDLNRDLDLGRGVTVNTQRLERLLRSDLEPFAEWGIKDTFTGLTRTDYESIRDSYEDRYGKGNVYFASRGFVEWAHGRWADKAVSEAIQLAKANKAKLHVVTAFEPTSLKRVQREAERVPADMQWAFNARDAIDARASHAAELAKDAGLEVESYTREASPAAALIDVAKERDADLIVVGNKGMNSAKGRVLGSVPNTVSHKAECSVLVVQTS